MLLIKRYSNRKLYDTEAKQYITLEGIAELIRTGAEVQVIDHETGDDLTNVIQSQIIFEQEKKIRGGAPRAVLNDLVRAGNNTLSRLRHALATKDWKIEVDNEIERRMLALIQAGDVSEDAGLGMLNKLIGPVEDDHPPAEEEAAKTRDWPKLLQQLDVPKRADLQKLIEQVEALNAEVQALQTPQPRKTTRAKNSTTRRAKTPA
jgi:polyhydroxyalkanoate synthesis repressor PhaR